MRKCIMYIPLVHKSSISSKRTHGGNKIHGGQRLCTKILQDDYSTLSTRLVYDSISLQFTGLDVGNEQRPR